MRSLIVAAFVSLAVPASAQSDEDTPHRIAAERIPLSGDPVDIAGCATRVLGRSGKAQPYPIRDGAGLGWTIPDMMFGIQSDEIIDMQFRRDNSGAFLKVLYRHPFSDDAALKYVRKAAKACFRADWNAWAAMNGRKAVR